MNIFWLDRDTEKAAEYHCDKHVVKMILELAQLLSTAHHVLDGPYRLAKHMYKPTHINHPCAKWVRESKHNYTELVLLLISLCMEYTHRYGKHHKVERGMLQFLVFEPDNIPNVPGTPKPLCMPVEYKVPGDHVASYRNYYRHGKKHLLQWKNRNTPEWI